jgi:putative heme iron utilization protein
LLLLEILSDLVKIDDILLIIKNDGAVSEIRSNSLSIRQKEKWITIGDNDGPAHMHINSELIKSAEFVQEEKPERTSFSVRFFNKNGERVLAAFFTKMYDESKTIISERRKVYDNLNQKYSSKIQFLKKNLSEKDK